MKCLLILVSIMCGFLSANAQLSLHEIRTASDSVLAAFFQSKNVSGPVWNTVFQTNEVDTSNLSLWTLNGRPVMAIHEFVTEADGIDYHIYLQVPKLAQGTAYTFRTPYGSTNFVFDDKRILCESIKVNQNGYSALSQVRYANFAIWLGDGGAKPISKDLPAYTVFKPFTGEQVAQGRLQQIGPDASSGDFVYRIDLSAVPEGGPYDPQRSADLQRRGEEANHYCESVPGWSMKTTHRLYYAIQKYLLTGDMAASNTINSLASNTSTLKDS